MYVKAFEEQTIIESQNLKNVTSYELTEDCLFLGTNTGVLYQYNYFRFSDENEKPVFETSLKNKKQLFSKPIDQIVYLSSLDYLIVESSKCLSLVNLRNLAKIPAPNKSLFANIICFSHVNLHISGHTFEASEVCTEVCLARKKSLLNIQISRQQLFVDQEISLPSPIRCMARQGTFVCAAFRNEYKMIDLITKVITPLFPFDSNTTPLVQVLCTKDGADVGNEPEFLLGVATTDTVSLGMFVNSSGGTTRPPLQFQANPTCLAFDFPYVVSVFEAGVEIHNIVDSQHKQTLVLDLLPVSIKNSYSGLTLYCTEKLYLLDQLSITSQVYSLLQEGYVDEGLNLAETFLKDNTMKTQEKVKVHQAFLMQAGHVCMSAGNFQRALDLFGQASVEISEVISLYGLLPTSSAPEQGDGECLVYSLVRGKPSLLKKGYEYLRDFLKRMDNVTQSEIPVIDTALLKLYVLLDDHSLLPFVQSDNQSIYEDCETFLFKHEKYVALAHYHAKNDKPVKSLNLWKRLHLNEIKDEDYEGLKDMTDYLACLKNNHLVYKYIDWLTTVNVPATVRILKIQTEEKKFSVRETLSFLQKNESPLLFWLYLDFVIGANLTQRKEQCTQLCLLYCSYLSNPKGEVKRKRAEETEETQHSFLTYKKLIEEFYNILEKTHFTDESIDGSIDNEKAFDYCRQRFQRLLEENEHYDFEVVFDKMKDTNLQRELSILHGKLGRHDEALRILVITLSDHKAARAYCIKSEDHRETEDLFFLLLSIYLVSVSENQKEDYLEIAINLLNRNGRYFDPQKVLEIIPLSWEIKTLQPFLRSSLRRTRAQNRENAIYKNLARASHIKSRSELFDLQNQRLVISAEDSCCVCQKRFSPESVLLHFPNGRVTHMQCSPKDKDRDPITKDKFVFS